ncbi:MAG TPA: glycosyltransferase family 87 protein [Bryobacteraceae bacterium]|nr:glycosyltransferase family 87 protein [Bryobacteraceae bacterium]
MIRWPHWLGPMPGRREAQAIAWMALAAGIILSTVSLVLGFHGLPFMGRPLGGDFVEFYTIGKILNTAAPARIYDLDLAVKLQHEILPAMSPTQMLVFGQAPYIAWLFRPFALLPYFWAYAAWLGFSAAAYLLGLRILFRALRLPREDRRTGYLLALSWAPFLFETWIGGQMAAVVFLIFALFFWCLENERPLLAGLALSLCLFKPTLVALPALMLLAGRRWRVAGGLAAGGAALGLASLATIGWEGIRAWRNILGFNAQVAAAAGDAWHRSKYVDLAAFLHLLLGNNQSITAILFVAASLAAVGSLGWAWWRSGGSARNELWAATLCFTLVVNAYTPIYDTVLAVIAMAFLATRLQNDPAASDREKFTIWLLLLYLVPWITQSFAQFLHLQLITLVLACFGFWALRQAFESTGKAGARIGSHPRAAQEQSTIQRHLQPRAAGRLWVRSRG